MAKLLWPEMSKGYIDFHENIIFLYGVPKIGKTSLAAQFSDALFILTEDGTKHVQVRSYRVKIWQDFISRLVYFEANREALRREFKTVVIDTADNLATQCISHVCEEASINTLGDLDYGKGYARFRQEFRTQINRLQALDLGMVFISHDEEKEVEVGSIINPYAPVEVGADGKSKIIVPTLVKQARQFLLGLSDIILYYKINKDGGRSIYTKPSQYFEAGDRSGRLTDSIGMGSSAEAGYTALLNSYYGNDPADACQALIGRINKAFEFLAEHNIDGFDVPTRLDNSILKHLGVKQLKDTVDIPVLQNYLHHLTMKANNKKETK